MKYEDKNTPAQSIIGNCPITYTLDNPVHFQGIAQDSSGYLVRMRDSFKKTPGTYVVNVKG